MATSQTAQQRQDFRRGLLRQTIEHARQRVPAYESIYQGLPTPETLADLPRLPIVEKSAMKRSLPDFRDQSLTTQLVQHTSGTTTDPLIIHRSQSEVAFNERFQQTSIEMRQRPSDGPNPIVIALSGNFHGQGTPRLYPGSVFHLDPGDSYWDLQKLFSEPASFTGSNCNEAVLVGTEPELRIITCRLLEMGFDFSSASVRTLLSTGNMITRRLRCWYETTWRATLFDHYSLTEMLAAGIHCASCGFRHLDPTVIGEAVDPQTRQSVSRGYGVLLITNLYPFVQQQPFIRYWTGDLIRLGPPCAVDNFSFELEGRLRTCVLAETEQGMVPLISGAAIYDIMDDFPDVNSSKMFIETQGISDHSALGSLKFAVEVKTNLDLLHIDVLVETRYPPYLYPERATWLCRELHDCIMKRHPLLEERVRERRVNFQCSPVPRGRVKSFQPDWVE